MPSSFDFYQIDEHLTPAQRSVRDQVRGYVEERVRPHINPYWERAEFPYELALGLAALPIMGGVVRGPGCAGLDPLAAGLVMAELARGDGSISTFYGVHSGLVMGAIGLLGAEEQRQRWLPGLARLEKIGAFGLTEPSHGSDAAHLQTTARRQGNTYFLNGAKRWIGNAAIADVLIIWARDDAGAVGGFVLEHPKTAAGLRIKNIGGKVGKRAVLNADLSLENVAVPAENRLAESRSFRDTARVLALTRYTVAWEALGLALGCFELALAYATQRQQFGRPLASFQLIQHKLVEMASELTQMQLLCRQLACLLERGRMTEGMVALAKYNNAGKARRLAQLAREIMGGNGLLLENHIARLWTDAEVVYTYEGTNEINLLIAGRELTGLNAVA
jgi:glutaryl-CoA dehydrogenase